MRRRTHRAWLAWAVVAMTVPASVGSIAAPTARAAPGVDPIYRIRVTIVTTSPAERLYLSGPSWFILGRSRVDTSRRGVHASFGGFGDGPLSLSRSERGGRLARATFVVALTPRGVSRLRFVSVKGRKGGSVIRIANLNRNQPILLRTVRHRRRRGTVMDFRVNTQKVADRGPIPGSAPLPPMVLAHYYPWWHMGTWYETTFAPYNHNDHPYDSGDPATIQRQIQQARGAGIDGFISSWWGQGSLTDKNLGIVFGQLPPGFKIAVSVNGFGDRFSTISGWVKQLAYVLKTYGSRSHYLKFQGAPVVYLWATRYVLESENGPSNPNYRSIWRRIFQRLRSAGYVFRAVGMYGGNIGDLSVFDGLRTYVTRYPSTAAWTDREMELVSRAYAAIHGGHRRIWGSGVFPGYDDRQLDRPDPFFLSRDNGGLYRSQWAAATAADSDQALVATFNEWHETTNIEPNRRWGNLYLQMTAARAAAFKSSR